jgi:hypothetical protein
MCNSGRVARKERTASLIGTGITFAGVRVAVASLCVVVDGTALAIVTASWPASPGIGWL